MVLNELPRQKLLEIVARYGPSIAEDPKRCKGLLMDLCGDYWREINALVSALAEQVAVDHWPQKRCANRSSFPLASQSYDRLGLD